MSVLVGSLFVILLVWALFAVGTQGSQSTYKKPGDQLSERGVTLVQTLFWLIIIVGFVVVLATSNS